jgi:hypothetical protein
LWVVRLATASATTDALYAQEDANVGKDYWVTGVVTFCQGSFSSLIIKDCILLSGAPVAGTHLKIDGIETHGLRSRSDSLAMFAAIRRASSLVSSLTAERRPDSFS